MPRHRRISHARRNRDRLRLVRPFNSSWCGSSTAAPTLSETASGDIAAQGKWAMERVLSQTDYNAATVPRNGPQVTRW